MTQTTKVTAEAEVLAADDGRFQAMARGDWAALDAALADDLTYVHSTARLESKAEHIANLRAGKPHYRGIAPRDRRARVHGGVGIVNGVSEMHVERDGKEQRFTVRYLAVYAKAGDRWRMVAWQSTRQPEHVGEGEGHAFAFPREVLMPNKSVPVVPVCINAYYPPNQPSAQRCYDFGKALARSVKSWAKRARVAFIARNRTPFPAKSNSKHAYPASFQAAVIPGPDMRPVAAPTLRLIMICEPNPASTRARRMSSGGPSCVMPPRVATVWKQLRCERSCPIRTPHDRPRCRRRTRHRLRSSPTAR